MKSRGYTMRTRAARAEQTRARILETATHLTRTHLRTDIRLEDIADKANVSVQTVLRVFGTKKNLLALALEQVLRDMATSLNTAEPGNITAAVRTWFDHYEEFGDVVIANLADERDPAVAPIIAIGRQKHRTRVETVFAPQLHEPTTHQIDALVCVTDVYTWKLLRRDMARPREQAEATMTMMINAVLGSD